MRCNPIKCTARSSSSEARESPPPLTRFAIGSVPASNVVLFVGTNDYLRQQCLEDTILRAAKNHQDVWVLGAGMGAYAARVARVLEPTWQVEEYVKLAGVTAGIYLGRTTIEGWLCGKPGYIYQITPEGQMLSVDLVAVPENCDLFTSETMASRILERYHAAL
jgi:hypothetical protein